MTGKILAVATENLYNVHCRDAQKVGGCRHKPSQHIHKRKDFHTQVIINNSLVNVLVDTGADVNVMSKDEAVAIGIPWNKSKIKLRPYGSKPLKVCGEFHGPYHSLIRKLKLTSHCKKVSYWE